MKKIINYIIAAILFIASVVLINLCQKQFDLFFFLSIGFSVAAIIFLCIGSLSCQKHSTRKLAIIGIMSALSIILYILIKFPLPFLFPSFLEIQVSEIPALLVSLAYGPEPGIIILIVRFVIKLLFSNSVGVGEMADLIISLVLVITASLFYKKHRSFKGAVLGCTLGVVLATAMAIFTNAFVLIPSYIQLFFNGDKEALVKACSIIPNINSNNFMRLYLLGAILPFNLIRYAIVMAITFPIYKNTHHIFDSIIG